MPEPPVAIEKEAGGAWRMRAALLVVWALASFGVAFFARDMDQVLAGWPLNYWLAAQGAVLVFMGIVVLYAWWMNRVEARQAAAERKDG